MSPAVSTMIHDTLLRLRQLDDDDDANGDSESGAAANNFVRLRASPPPTPGPRACGPERQGVVQRASESTRPYSLSSSADSSALRVVLSVKEPPKYSRLDDPEYCKWKVKEREILNDIEPVVLLAKEILHSDRYMDGEQLTEEDEMVVVERLLAHHPHSEDKIGCGIDSIMMKFSGGPVTGTLVGGGGGLIVRRSRHRLLGPPHRHQAAPLQALRLSA